MRDLESFKYLILNSNIILLRFLTILSTKTTVVSITIINKVGRVAITKSHTYGKLLISNIWQLCVSISKNDAAGILY